jgi:DNA recombination protein RmuC
MQIDTLILLSGITIGFIVLSLLVLRSKKNTEQVALLEWLSSMQTSLERTNRTLQETLRGTNAETNRVLLQNTRQLNERLDTAANVIGELKRHMGEFTEVGRGIKDLQTFLQSPKLRGGLGEEVLADMIAQLFPQQSYQLQYSFKSGVKVDAVIKTDGGLLCIDAKFPFENFMAMQKFETEVERNKAKKEFINDVKKHLHDISKKYILPEEGTLDFALMYIPSEAVYYEIVMTQEIMTLAKRARIYPVSPNTLYAHLQVLLVSFQGKELEKRTHEIMKLLRAIGQDYEKISDNFAVLTKHTTVRSKN